MEETNNATTASLYGGGGKFRKAPARKTPSTPYDRPATEHSRRVGGWLSKVVDPAYRLISGGATRLFPSFFSQPPPMLSLPSSATEDQEVKQDANNGDQNCTPDLGITRSTGGAESSEAAAARSNYTSSFVEHGQVKLSNDSVDNGLSKIEQMITGKCLSRDEINRLTEILHSKAADLSTVKRGKIIQSNNTGVEAEGAVLAHKTPRKSMDEVQEDLNGAKLDGLSLRQSRPHDKVGASPVDIAKEFMKSRTSEAASDSQNVISKDERNLPYSSEIAINPFMPSSSSSPRPSVCWPGAMVQDRRGFLTPQSQRDRFGFQNFPRTPYSRDLYSKSKSRFSQLQGDGDKSLSISTPSQQSRTPVSGQVTSVKNVAYGSVGPIRRSRQKYGTHSETPTRGSFSLRTSQTGPSRVDNLNISKGLSLTATKHFEAGEASGGAKLHSVESKPHSNIHQSSEIARKILEHLDRTVPTPKEKSMELRLATQWKKSSASVSNASALVDQNGGDRGKSRFGSQPLDTSITDRGKSLFGSHYRDTASNTEASDSVKKITDTTHNGVAGPASGSGKIQDSQVKIPHENTFAGFGNGEQNLMTQSWATNNQTDGPVAIQPNVAGYTVPNPQKKPQPQTHSSGSRPVLSSIAIGKRNPMHTFSTSGFTFPVSATSTELSELPTPSIMPFSAAQSPPLQKDDTAPTFSFGSKATSPALVFSFPSTSNASKLDDTSDIKFAFGSEKTKANRLNFSSVGKDAICY